MIINFTIGTIIKEEKLSYQIQFMNIDPTIKSKNLKSPDYECKQNDFGYESTDTNRNTTYDSLVSLVKKQPMIEHQQNEERSVEREK